MTEREAYILRLLSEAPPLTASQQQLIRRTLGPVNTESGGAA